ncbi:MAG: hypothetical protein M3135_01980 [Actinomycetota bacterium]|nr:hypothetical protein [Actinomycetota bacterium]
MFAWLRRRQPRHPLLAILYWLALVVVTFAVLMLIFFQLDRFLPSMY